MKTYPVGAKSEALAAEGAAADAACIGDLVDDRASYCFVFVAVLVS